MNCPRLVYLCFLILFFQDVNSDERILSFHSDISVDGYGAIEVTETIVVRAEQNKIRRGIYRDFPTTYQDRLGNRYRVESFRLSVSNVTVCLKISSRVIWTMVYELFLVVKIMFFLQVSTPILLRT